ncbi:MAG: hypothetical protein AB8H03_18855 [Saprospiraceae bacterium]
MDYKNINNLLEKYWEGETSLQEEDKLKQYFNNGNVAPQLEQYKSLFQYFKEEQDVMISDDFEKRLLEQIENESKVVPAKIRKLSWMTSIRTIAAVGILLMGAVFVFQNLPPDETDVWAQYEIEDEQEAIEATKAALALLSGKMKKGSKKATKGFSEMKTVTKKALK